eukprot:SAG25_NODE_527_length_7183_cov_5.308018_1_plen_73_part_00
MAAALRCSSMALHRSTYLSRYGQAQANEHKGWRRSHSLYWHFSYVCFSCWQVHGRKKLSRRHSFRSINLCAQ